MFARLSIAAARRALLWTAGVPVLGLVAFFVMLATVVPAEGWLQSTEVTA